MAKRWIFYLALNVLVSAATMLGVLFLWNRSQQSAAPAPTAPLTLQPHGEVLPLPAVSPTPKTFLYTVKAGDTLGRIAEQFGVTVEELVEVNNLENPDWLEPGMTLIIPVHGETGRAVPDDPTVTPQEGEQAPWPFIESVVSPGNLLFEAVRITNPGPNAVLTGWRLRAPSGTEYVFAEFSLVAQGAVLVHTAEGVDTAIDLYWNLKETLWHSGDEVILLDPLGNLRSAYVIP
ncbi:MAG: LysM peptidoglycan-binding domain-containing protein [Anaerolineales bacterium]|nr:LysM peptidoglycan-binding domain-containing protein [Anaerolineales bacterium]